MPNCINCGSEIAENAKFCMHCGAVVAATAVEAEQEAAAVAEEAATEVIELAAAPEEPEAPAPKPTVAPVEAEYIPKSAAVEEKKHEYTAPKPPVVGIRYDESAEKPAEQPVEKPGKKSKMDIISTAGYIGVDLLLAIPGVGLILAIIWACGGCRKYAKRNYARSRLIFMLVGIVLLVAAALVIRFAFPEIISNIAAAFGYSISGLN